jgi:hypothetical protein
MAAPPKSLDDSLGALFVKGTQDFHPAVYFTKQAFPASYGAKML